MAGSTHEDLSQHAETTGGSNRSFGLVFAGFFLLVALTPLRRHQPVRLWAVTVSVIFLILGLVIPAFLGPFNRLWMRLAVLLSKITNPILTGLMFFLVFTPVAVVLRWMGKDLLLCRFDPKAQTYWAQRSYAPASKGMRNLF